MKNKILSIAFFVGCALCSCDDVLDALPADGNGRTVIRMAEAEKQQDGSRTYGKDENKKDEKRVC